MKDMVRLALELVKIRITVAVTVTTFMGYVLAARSVSFRMLVPLLGTLLLACGSAVFNHLQESRTDRLMDRTRNRPLPSGRVTAGGALAFGFALALAGSVMLAAGAGLVALGLGWLAMVWYNGIYTPLKKKHPMAVIPGALIGAIPPAIGWVAGGGHILDERIGVVCLFFFVWQVPHFWLLMLRYDRDYRQAGFPTLRQMFSREQVLRITFVWMAAVCVMSIGLKLYGILSAPVLFALLVVGAGWLAWRGSRILVRAGEEINLTGAFRGINTYALLVVVLVAIDTLVM